MNETVIYQSQDATVNTQAVQNAISDLSCDVVTLVGDVFNVGKRALRAAIRLSDRTRPLVIRGIGNTTVRLSDMNGGLGGDCHVLAFDRCANLTIENITIDGNRGAFAGFTEQAHGLYVNGCKDVLVSNVHTKNVLMDGFYFIGQSAVQSDPFCQRLVIRDTSHTGNNRSGLAFQGGTTDVLVDGLKCVDIKNAAIDTEPTGGRQSSQHFVIRNVDIEPRNESYAVSIAGQYGNVANHFLLENVTIRNGSMQIMNAHNVSLNRVIIAGRKERNPLTVRASVDGLAIRNGFIVGRQSISEDGSISIGGLNGENPGRIAMYDTQVICVTPRSAVSCENADRIELYNCELIGNGGQSGINSRNISRTEGLELIKVHEGRITGFANGIYIRPYADRHIHNLLTNRVSISNANVGVYVEGSAYLDNRIVDNLYDAVLTEEYYE